jgi:hypothetical protein
MVFRPNSLPSTAALQGVDAIAVRDRADDADGSARAPANSSAAGSEPAAVVRFGAEALRLARSTMTASRDARSADVSDSGDAPTVRRPANEDETEALLADALGPNETDAALVDTIDGSSTFPRVTENDARASAFPRSPEGRPKSGFFLSATAAASDSGLFASATATTTTESRFATPKAPESRFPHGRAENSGAATAHTALASNGDTALSRASAQTRASTFPRVPRSTAFAAAFASQGNAWEPTRARAAAADSSFTEARPASAFPRAASSSTADSAAERREPTAPRAASNMLAASNSGTMGRASVAERKAAAAEGLARQSRAQLAAERYAEAQEALGRE